MTRIFAAILGIALLLYGTAPMATARSGTEVHSVIICGDFGAREILIDNEGNPVAPARECTDCCIGCLTMGVTPPLPPVARMAFSSNARDILIPSAPRLSSMPSFTLKLARAPPVPSLSNDLLHIASGCLGHFSSRSGL